MWAVALFSPLLNNSPLHKKIKLPSAKKHFIRSLDNFYPSLWRRKEQRFFVGVVSCHQHRPYCTYFEKKAATNWRTLPSIVVIYTSSWDDLERPRRSIHHGKTLFKKWPGLIFDVRYSLGARRKKYTSFRGSFSHGDHYKQERPPLGSLLV